MREWQGEQIPVHQFCAFPTRVVAFVSVTQLMLCHRSFLRMMNDNLCQQQSYELRTQRVLPLPFSFSGHCGGWLFFPAMMQHVVSHQGGWQRHRRVICDLDNAWITENRFLCVQAAKWHCLGLCSTSAHSFCMSCSALQNLIGSVFVNISDCLLLMTSPH